MTNNFQHAIKEYRTLQNWSDIDFEYDEEKKKWVLDPSPLAHDPLRNYITVLDELCSGKERLKTDDLKQLSDDLKDLRNQFIEVVKQTENHNTMEKENTTAGKTACYAKFKIKNLTEKKSTMCLLPGIARDLETLSRLGFKADGAIGSYTISGYDGWEFDDFLQVVRGARCDLKKLIIQNCTADPAIFDESIVIGRTIKA